MIYIAIRELVSVAECLSHPDPRVRERAIELAPEVA